MDEDLFEGAPCGYLITRADGSIVRANRTFERWTGYAREDLAGRRLVDLLTPGGRIYHETHYAPLLRMQGEVHEIALDLQHADGSVLPVIVNSVVVGDAVRTVLLGATERRRYERELVLERRRAEGLQRRAALLAEAGRAMAEVLGVAERAQRLAELVVPGLFESAAVVTARPMTLIGAAGPEADDERMSAVMESAMRTGRPALSRETDAPFAAVPLRAGHDLIGALGVARTRRVDGIDPAELDELTELAARAALALENARLYEHERQVAHTLQRSMLAGDPPRHPRCAIGTHYSPAEATLEVGGDWHDAFFLGRDRLAIVVGDVVGRGLPAATMMGQLRSALRALAGARLGPAGVLQSLDAFVEQTSIGPGATVAYAELELQTGELTLACAGHPPPVLVRPGAAPELIWEGRSAPLGAYAGPTTREDVTLELPRGARLLLYTDGLVERRGETLDVGLNRLLAAFGRAEEVSVTRVGEALSSELMEADSAADDVCLLALSFGSSDPFELHVPADAARLRTLRQELRGWLEARGVTGSDRDAVVLACAETAANAIEHGYRDRGGQISVVADTTPGEITIEVGDLGDWRVPAGRGRGRGMSIVAHVMDEVVVDRGRGTRVTMRRRLRGPCGG